MSTDSANDPNDQDRDAGRRRLNAINRPGLDEIKNGIGSHGEILERMLRNLAGQQVPGPGGEPRRPLASLSTRTADDPAVALLDAWSTTLDVLSFYQERNANEGYLRTARERRSIQELAGAVGYELKPGISAGVQLNFTVEDAEGAPETVAVPRGTKVLSIPGQNELPRTFETSIDFTARADWNKLNPRLTEEQAITAGATELYVQGANYGLQPGDGLLFVGNERESDPGSEHWDFRIVTRVEPDPVRSLTLIAWQDGLGHPQVTPAAAPRVFRFRQVASVFGASAPVWSSLTEAQRAELTTTVIDTHALALAADGARFFAGGDDHQIHLYAIETGQTERSFTGHGRTINVLAAAPDGTHLASASTEDFVILWNATSGAEITRLTRDAGDVRALAFAPDSSRLADAGTDKIINITELTGANALQTTVQLSGHGAAVNALAFIPGDADRIVSGSSDGSLRLWDIATGTASVVINAHSRMITAIDVSDTGDFFLSGSTDDTIQIHRATGETVASVPTGDVTPLAVYFRDAVPRVNGIPLAFTALLEDGSTKIWTGSYNGNLLQWQVDGFPVDVGDNTESALLLSGERVIAAGSSRVVLYENDGTETRVFAPPLNDPGEWPGFGVGVAGNIDLDTEYPRVAPGSWVVLRQENMAETYRVLENTLVQREDYLLNARVTRLNVDSSEHMDWFDPRLTQAYIETNEIQPADFPLPRSTPIQGDTIELDRLVSGLDTGKVLIVSGKRSRLQVKAGVNTLQLKSPDQTRQYELIPGELLLLLETPLPDPEQPGNLIWQLESKTGFRGFESIPEADSPFEWLPAEADDDPRSETVIVKNAYPDAGRTYTVIQFSSALVHTFDPQTFHVSANIIPATNGETIDEVLGSGDGSRANQSFILRKPPVTHVSAPTVSGARNTLEVRVNDLPWEEAPSLYNLGPGDRKYIVSLEPDGGTRITFGDGTRGARLPTGSENVRARYRTGIGRAGEVPAESLRLLQTRPLGIREVTNPLAASGSAEPEARDTARERTPMAVRALGRMVSLPDYEGFIRVFAGIGKARASGFQRGEEQIVHVTIAGEDGADIAPTTDLYLNLKSAVESSRSPFQTVEIDSYRPRNFNVAARLLIDPAFESAAVFTEAERCLRDHFSFTRRSFGQNATAADVITALQKTPGVLAVDLDQLYRDGTTLELDITLQTRLENTTSLGAEARAELNRQISGDETLPYGERALVIEDKAETRWLVREQDPNWTDAHVIVKDAGKLRIYPFPRTVTPFLEAADAKMTGEIIEPAELLLLNPVSAGVILMEFQS